MCVRFELLPIHRAVAVLSVSIVTLFLAGLPIPAEAEDKGQFVGRIVSEWLPDGRRMKLLEPFSYIDANKRRWSVPSGTVVDGASIPQAFWTIIGAPFSGAYRNASVIHDHYCEARTRRSQDVHRVFYEAMKASGVGESRAWLMYKAVERFGPTWDELKRDPACEEGSPTFDFERCATAARKPLRRQPKVDRDGLDKFLQEVKGGADPDDIRKLQAAIKNMD